MNLTDVLETYHYQPRLTERLDKLTSLDERTLNEIVLWKVNRYVQLDSVMIDELNGLRRGMLNDCDRGIAKDLLGRLITVGGVKLPMASTILRFVNCDCFAIFDWRAHEVVFPADKRLSVPHGNLSERQIKSQCDLYFRYLDVVFDRWNQFHHANIDLSFCDMDRLLYQLSKEVDKKVAYLRRENSPEPLSHRFARTEIADLLRNHFDWTDEAMNMRVQSRSHKVSSNG
jgi:hypothetical protein